MSTVRGRGRSLEIAVDRALAAAVEELRSQFASRPDFYRGSRAVANLGILEPPATEIAAFRDALAEFGITLDGVSGVDAIAEVVAELDLAYLGSATAADVAALPRRSATPREVRISEEARSLVADFAGAREDMVRRRKDGPLPATAFASAAVKLPQPARSVPVGISTLYHRGTLRGGQALHNLGNLVVIGDVNPGAELVASGDIVVFGALRGVAHAGAQGDRAARVIALELAPTQLRIATLIATSDAGTKPRGPEHASIADERIVVVPFAEADLRKEQQAL
ncbi:MAG: septum site-determining protein MinC [Candidatus Eremiobacteraeota bacterium]|jgi:septum site-determining protein MinC|nr:septum site-determining protein MinC [Candidatus Eremiobacteraeota bacterium]